MIVNTISLAASLLSVSGTTIANTSCTDAAHCQTITTSAAEVQFVPQQLLVQFHSPITTSHIQAFPHSHNNKITLRESISEALGDSLGAYQIKNVQTIRQAKAKSALFSANSQHPTSAIYQIDFEGVSPHALVQLAEQLKTNTQVAFSEPNYLYHTQAAVQPNDPLQTQQYHLNATKLYDAWQQTTGSQEVVVAVIDTGVDLTHPDLINNLWQNTAELQGTPGVDDDGNGCVDDFHGCDFVDVDASQVADGEDYADKDGDPSDFQGHGTHVAGIIGAKGNNNLGISGVAWDTSIMALRSGYKTPNNQGSFTLAALIEAINYATENQADIINMSLGGPAPSELFKQAINHAVANGVFVISAAGNSSDTIPQYPAAYVNSLAVASIDKHENISVFSSRGNWVDLAAPGSDILSTVIGGNYEAQSGTSMAAPVVSGIAALIKSSHPNITVDELKLRLLSSAKKLHLGSFNSDHLIGAGVVDAQRANLSYSQGNFPEHIALVEYQVIEANGNANGEYEAGEQLQLLVSVKNFGQKTNINVVASSRSNDVTFVNESASFNQVDHLATVTNSTMPILIDINTSADINQTVALTITTSNGKTISHLINLPLNSSWRPNVKIFDEKDTVTNHVNPLPNGGVITIVTDEYTGNIGAFVAEPNQTDFTKPSFLPTPIRNSYVNDVFVDSSGVAHIVFNALPLNGERLLYYVTFSKAQGWSEVETVSQLRTPGAFYKRHKVAIGVSDSGTIHINWSDLLNQQTQLFHARKDAHTWVTQPLLPLSDNSSDFSIHLVKLAAEHFQLFYSMKANNTDACYAGQLINNAWQTWQTLSQCNRVSLPPIVHNNQAHLVYKKEFLDSTLYIATFNGQDWQNERVLLNSQFRRFGALDDLFSVVIEQNDLFHIFYNDVKGISYWQGQPGAMSFTALPFLKNALLKVRAVIDSLNVKHVFGIEHEKVGGGFGNSSGIQYLTTADWSSLTRLPQVENINAQINQDLNAMDIHWQTVQGDVSYQYAVGTAPGFDNIVAWADAKTYQNYASASVNPLKMVPNQAYFVTLRAIKANQIETSIDSYSAPIFIPSAVDSQPPSKPTQLTAQNIQPTSFTLNWQASTDNIGVVEYEIYQNGQLLAHTSSTSFIVNNLSPNSQYTYTVRAVDAAGNRSEASSALTVNTTGNDLINACAIQGPEDYTYLHSNSPVCVTTSHSDSNMLYFYFDSQNATSATITTGHGNGDATLYYSNYTWPSTWNYTQKSEQLGNSEEITINHLSPGWQYIAISGNHSGLTLQLTLH